MTPTIALIVTAAAAAVAWWWWRRRPTDEPLMDGVVPSNHLLDDEKDRRVPNSHINAVLRHPSTTVHTPADPNAGPRDPNRDPGRVLTGVVDDGRLLRVVVADAPDTTVLKTAFYPDEQAFRHDVLLPADLSHGDLIGKDGKRHKAIEKDSGTSIQFKRNEDRSWAFVTAPDEESLHTALVRLDREVNKAMRRRKH